MQKSRLNLHISVFSDTITNIDKHKGIADMKDSDSILVEALAFQCVRRNMMITQADEILQAYSIRTNEEEASAPHDVLLEALYDAILREDTEED
jgi:hypothetical protein